MPPDIRGRHTIAGVSKRVEFEYDLLGQGHQMVHYTPTLGSDFTMGIPAR